MDGEGVRARKRRETRARIVETGLRLFLAHGYDATTLDGLALAAGISRRSFFHHFRSKDDVLLAWQDGFYDQLRAAVAARPAGEPPLEAAVRAMLGLADGYASDEMVAIDRLMRSSEVLQSRKQAGYLRQEIALYEALAERAPDPRLRPVLRQAAMVAVGVMRLALEAWAAEGRTGPIARHLQQGYADLRAALAEAPG